MADHAGGLLRARKPDEPLRRGAADAELLVGVFADVREAGPERAVALRERRRIGQRAGSRASWRGRAYGGQPSRRAARAERGTSPSPWPSPATRERGYPAERHETRSGPQAQFTRARCTVCLLACWTGEPCLHGLTRISRMNSSAST
jgi:hypothetical protein